MKRLPHRVLSLDVHPQYMGFAAFEGPTKLLEYGGLSYRRGVNVVRAPLSKRLSALLEFLRPSLLVVRRTRGSAKAMSVLLRVGTFHRTAIHVLSGDLVRQAIDKKNKLEIASSIVVLFPELASRLPRERGKWKCEDYYRTAVFDAVHAGLTYFAAERKRSS